MTRDDDFIGQLEGYLDEFEGVTPLPDGIRDAVRAQLPTTQQTGPITGLMRHLTMNRFVMNTYTRLAILAAAVVVVVVAGATLLPRTGGLGGEPSPSPAPSESPAPSLPPTPTPSTRSLLGTTDLDPGTYAIGTFFPVQFDLTIADRWETWGTSEHIVRIWKPCEPSACTGYSSILDFEMVSATYADPCQSVLGSPIGKSVDELVNALTNLPGFDAGPVTEVSLDGHAGKTFELTYIGPNEETCVDGGTWQWLSNEPVGWGTDARQRVLVLDVDGTRLVIDAIVYSGDRQEMDAIIDTIVFH